MKVKFNKNKLIPNIKEYLKILLSVVITVYVLKGFILHFFPSINNLPEFWLLVFWVFLVTWLKNLFDIRIFGRDYF